MIALKERISDPRILELIKQWLEVTIVETNGRYTSGKKNKQCTPQEGVISPLLANVYITFLDRIVNKVEGHFSKFGIQMIRYADNFILIGKHIRQEY